MDINSGNGAESEGNFSEDKFPLDSSKMPGRNRIAAQDDHWNQIKIIIDNKEEHLRRGFIAEHSKFEQLAKLCEGASEDISTEDLSKGVREMAMVCVFLGALVGTRSEEMSSFVSGIFGGFISAVVAQGLRITAAGPYYLPLNRTRREVNRIIADFRKRSVLEPSADVELLHHDWEQLIFQCRKNSRRALGNFHKWNQPPKHR